MEYHGKFGHTIGRIYHIAIIRIIYIFYTAYHLGNQTMTFTLTGFQGIKHLIQYMDSHPHKPIFYPYNYFDG